MFFAQNFFTPSEQALETFFGILYDNVNIFNLFISKYNSTLNKFVENFKCRELCLNYHWIQEFEMCIFPLKTNQLKRN